MNIRDALNMAEAARQVGNIDLAVRILIEAIGGHMTPHERDARIEDAARKITRLRDFMRGSGLSGRGADRVVDGIIEAIFPTLEEETLLSQSACVTLRQIARECGAAVPGDDELYRDEEDRS